MIRIAKKKGKKKFSNPKKLSLQNLKNEKLNSGTYKLLDQNKRVIYVGTSKQLQHRLFAVLYGRSDYVQVKGKNNIRKRSKYYQTFYTSVNNSRKVEKKSRKYKHKSSKGKKKR